MVYGDILMETNIIPVNPVLVSISFVLLFFSVN